MALRSETTPTAAPARGESHGRVYAGQTAAERDADRRERLLTTIHEIVGIRGYSALTVERLCASANVSTRSFYQLYDSKETAFADLYDTLLNRSSTLVLNSLVETEGRPMRERVPLAFWAFVGPMLHDLRTARITFVEVVGLSPRIEATRLRTRARLIELIEAEGRDAVARGEVADRDFHFAALALIGAATAVAQDWMMQPQRQRPPMEQLERQLTELAIQLITA